VGKSVVVIANLKPRQMKFGLSEGMVLAAGKRGSLRVCTFDEGPAVGDRVS
jgi:methionyl-tRNA synthetase